MAKPSTNTTFFQLTGRITKNLGPKFKIALLKNGHEKDAVIESLAKYYIKYGLPTE